MHIKKLNNPVRDFWEDMNIPLLPSLLKNMPNAGMGVNVFEEDNNLIVEIAAPGIPSKDKFNISIDNDHNLTVSIEDEQQSNEEKTIKNRVYHIKEINDSHKQVSIALPTGIDLDSAKASYDHGILTVVFDKRGSDTVKKITID